MNILVLGANGQIAREAIKQFLETTDHNLTLYLRNASRISDLKSDRVSIIEGDVLDTAKLTEATKGQSIVYANLAGNMEGQTTSIIQAMHEAGVKRLITISTLGIYDEVPGEFGKWNNKMIGAYFGPYKQAADLVEASDLNYTIIRAVWLTNKDEITYETTEKNEPFKGTEVSRKSVAALVVELSKNPSLHSRANIGINKPNTEGHKPSLM